MQMQFRWNALAPYATDDRAREAYARAGEDFAAQLDGEFAAVVCDPARRRVLAARSALAGPALWYAVSPEGLAIAETPEALVPLTGRTVEPETIRDFLRGELRDPERTFIRGLRRLPPGHVLVATADSLRATRWFHPPGQESESESDRPGELRAHLERAVAAALDPDPERPTVAHLSGGIDSSAVAALAARTARKIVLAAGRYPRLACDEGAFIAAARARLDAPFREWDGARTLPLDLDAPPAAHPWLELQAGDAAAEAELVRAAGARVVLTGHGGDELFFERGVFRDLAAHGRLATLVREARLAPRYSTQTTRFFLTDAARGLWQRHPGASQTQAFTWRWLTSSHGGWMRDLQDHALARAGVRYRRPLLDGRLARFVLGLPWRSRLPGGRMKALLRDAVRDLLPPAIAERTEVTTFESAILHHARAARPAIALLLEAGPWRSEPFIARADARKHLSALDAGDVAGAQSLFAIASLERWLRALERPDAFA